MSVTKKDVETVAELARLKFTDDEKEELIGTLNNILGYFDKLSEIDTENVEPLTHILPVQNVTREDEIKPTIGQEKALGNAPKEKRSHNPKYRSLISAPAARFPVSKPWAKSPDSSAIEVNCSTPGKTRGFPRGNSSDRKCRKSARNCSSLPSSSGSPQNR